MGRDFHQDSLVIEVRGNYPDALERAIREFKKGFEVSGLLREIKRREFYLSKNQKRRAKDRTAKRRAAKEAKRKVRFQARLGNRKDKEVKP